LDGTPYSLPPAADDAIAEMRMRLRRARTSLRDALREAERIGLVREMDRAHAYWTVFESNSIEFEGPDLSGTVEAIESAPGQNVIRDLNVTLLPRTAAPGQAHVRGRRTGDRALARAAVHR
jgi:hypothetical protein